jgi:phosphoserine phosphatase
MFIATLIAPGTLAGSDISTAADVLRDAGCEPGATVWIDEGFAADIGFTGDPAAAREVLESNVPAVDIVVQPAQGRVKALLVADMDSTMITVECIDELADYAGIKPQIAEITERAMRGELDFEAALDARVALLKGLDEAVIEQCLAERVVIMPGAVPLIRTMRARGALTILVSGGFTRFAEPVATIIGFDRAIANVLEVADGTLTGTVTKPIVGSDTKLQTLLNAVAERGLAADQTLAVGDGANDLAMIKRAGLGVAYRAKPIVAAAAAARVSHNDLTALLYAQGIAKADWVTE